MVKNLLQWGRPRFDPWIGNIPWRRKWQPTPVFLPEESNGRRSLAGYSPWGFKELDTTEQLIWEVGRVCSNPSSTASLIFLATTASCFHPGPIYRQIDPLASNHPTVKFYFFWYFFQLLQIMAPKKKIVIFTWLPQFPNCFQFWPSCLEKIMWYFWVCFQNKNSHQTLMKHLWSCVVNFFL